MSASEDRIVAKLPLTELLAGKRPGTGLADTEPSSFDPGRLRAGRLERAHHAGQVGIVLEEPREQLRPR